MSVPPETIFSLVLGFMWLEFIWEAFISARQRKIYKVGPMLYTLCPPKPPNLFSSNMIYSHLIGIIST